MGKHEKTLAAIFTDPISANIKWRDIESLFLHLGATLKEGRGSRIRVLLSGRKAAFPRPHPDPCTDKGAIASVRRLLTDAGLAP
jgi:hypothetical protein